MVQVPFRAQVESPVDFGQPGISLFNRQVFLHKLGTCPNAFRGLTPPHRQIFLEPLTVFPTKKKTPRSSYGSSFSKGKKFLLQLSGSIPRKLDKFFGHQKNSHRLSILLAASLNNA